MMRRLGCALIVAVLASPALAQAARTDFEDLRPKDMQFPDGLGFQELPISPVPEELLPQTPAETETPSDAQTVSSAVFGQKVDAAYGAYQRGYYLTALDLALPRAEKGDAPAQTLIAEIYSKGLGVPENLASAASWYGLASKNGDPLATFELAMAYQDGRGVTKDRKRAAELFKTAADAGNMMAKYNLGLLHVEGVYAEPSLTKAAQLIGEAANSGIAEARYDYAGMLAEGAGVAPDPAGATEQFRLAAEDGLIPAQVEYATSLYLGKGVPVDRAAAASWYARAADAGNPVAQNRYAKLLAAGEGVTLNLEDAAMYRALSRRQGLKDPQLDKLLASILPEELARAEERARFWPSPPPTRVAANTTPAPVAAPADAPLN
ncbi:MAG: sel1 repeat family protein [Devosia sp.]|uniref:sel1 repeat family protein n=1 Tax=Devosia sp. TaxID=1871048 RepID=UPI002619DC0C|nr:sel1 repeat family protein [Devosia sp.]MDB5539771.1 sel1 repeat family protein [Devosia sp.]